MKHLNKETIDGAQQNLAALYQLFPSCFTEAPAIGGGKNLRQVVNWGKLRELLGDNVADDEPEVYDFTWVGKRAAQREAMAPIRKTLRPCPEESVNWDTTQNLYIEGDNLEVLKLLQNSYMGKVKMIYIDPPYNTGNDFVYHDDFHRTQKEEDEAAGVINEEGERMVKNTESNGKFHSDWCSMIYSRLLISRNLLTNDGIIIVSIGEKEISNLLAIMDEVFGSSNQVCVFVWKSRAKPTNAGNAKYRPQKVSEYVLVYSKKSPDDLIFNVIPAKERTYPHKDEFGEFRTTTILTSNRGTFRRETMRFESHGYTPDDDFRWKAGKTTIDNLFETNHILLNEDGVPMEKKYKSEESLPLYPIYTYMDSDLSGTAESGKSDLADLIGKRHGFDTVKPVQLIKYLIQTFANKDDLVVDFFSGSGTTAQSCLEQNFEDLGNRKFLLVQYPEIIPEDNEAKSEGYKNICEIGKERIRRAGKKIKEENPDAKNLDIGFRVFKCDESNYKNVAFAPKDYSQESLDLFVDNIKEDRSDLDLLFDCMLRWGITLDLPMTKTKVDGCTIHNVNEGGLVACFDGIITEKVIDAIADMYPAKIVFRDSSFEEAVQKMNLFELFKQKCNWTEQEVKNNVRVI